ncbi:MAG: alpha/beta fold hydrolase [Pseudomonadota bacterium]
MPPNPLPPNRLSDDLVALDAQLRDEEQRYRDIRPGAEQGFQWASGRPERQPLSIVYIHGFAATRREASPLCERLGETLGANVFFARLSGHGRSDDAMASGSVDAWCGETERAIEIGRRIGERVVVVGLSTGATLILWALARDSRDIGAQILISPNFGPRDRRSELLTVPGGRWIARAVVGKYFEFPLINAEQARWWTMRFPSCALVPMMQSVRLARLIDPQDFTVPTQMFYCPNDDLVDPRRIERFYAQLGAEKRMMCLEQTDDTSRHTIVGDIMAPQGTAAAYAATHEFLQHLDLIRSASRSD